MPKNNKLGCFYSTQLKLAKSLKDLMSNQPFEKLSVSDITSNCDLHRQTFYYHFDDKYELLDWIVYKELITMVDEKKFYLNALKIDVNDMSKYINRLAYDQFMVVINCIEKNSGLKSGHEENLMLAEFLGYGLVGIVFGWAQRGMKDSPEIMTKRLERIINNLKHIAIENRR